MQFDPSILLDRWPDLLHGFALTLLIWVVGSVLGMLLGFAISIVQTFALRPLRWLCDTYIAVLRGTPFLIQLFILYYGGPFVGLDLAPLTAGILGLAIYGSAYFAVIFTSGFDSVPKGQIEAARMAGFGRLQIVRYVQVPQMLVIILPTLANMIVILAKETAVLSVITVEEMTSVVSSIGSTTYAYAETLLFLALFYWGLVEVLTITMRRVEIRVGRFRARQAR